MPKDEDLEDLKEQRKEELRKQDGSDQEEARDQQREQIKQRAKKYLTNEAASRLGNIRAADPDKAAAIEMQLARMGDMGQISENEVTDERLKQILRSLGENQKKNESDLKFRR